MAITDLEADEGTLELIAAGSIAVANTTELQLGETVRIEGDAGRAVELTVAATITEGLDVFEVGALVHPADFDNIVDQPAPTAAFIDVAAGAKAATQEQLEAATEGRPDLALADGNLLGKLVGSIFDFLINAVNGLLGMSVAVAVIGIINTLTLSIYERRRELGLLRVVGMTDRRVQRMVRVESMLIAVLGTVSGVGLGLLAGATSVAAINRLSEATINLNFAAGRLGLVLVAGVALGFAASLIPARRSTNLEVLEAIQAA